MDKGAIKVTFQLQGHLKAIQFLMGKYADIPMSYADACLVRMAECLQGTCIFTMDSDFKFYRKHGHELLTLIFPDA